MSTKPQFFTSKASLPEGAKIVEAYESARKELFYIIFPQHKRKLPNTEEVLSEFLNTEHPQEIWVYYEDSNTVVHTVEEAVYTRLRSSRNRNIITDEEQRKYREASVGIAGLSVGSSALDSLVMSVGPKYLKIADFDEVEITNLNRIKASLLDIGSNKTDVAARRVWAVDPFAELAIFDKGITQESLSEFILGKPQLDVFVDEMDSIDLKIFSRLFCRDNHIPVVMATDNGNSVILDVERFDLEPEREIFHGLVGHMKYEDLKGLDFKMWLKLATQIVGPEYLTERMQDTLLEIGKSVTAVPQLGPTAAMAGAGLAYAVRMIVTGATLPSGRYTYGLESVLTPGYNEAEAITRRKEKLEKFISSFGK